jgi:hypothetical protein
MQTGVAIFTFDKADCKPKLVKDKEGLHIAEGNNLLKGDNNCKLTH